MRVSWEPICQETDISFHVTVMSFLSSFLILLMCYFSAAYCVLNLSMSHNLDATRERATKPLTKMLRMALMRRRNQHDVKIVPHDCAYHCTVCN